MKKSTIASLGALLASTALHAQEKVEVGGHDVGTWFKDNWMWIAGVILILLIIVFSMGSRSRRKSTTVVKDDFGNVKSVTRTEEVD